MTMKRGAAARAGDASAKASKSKRTMGLLFTAWQLASINAALEAVAHD
jgi:hypothetical protein